MTSFDPFEPRMSEEAFNAYLQLCQEIFLEMQNAGTWPWPDSPNPKDLVESSDT